MQKSTSLKYEPSSELLLITAKHSRRNGRSVCGRGGLPPSCAFTNSARGAHATSASKALLTADSERRGNHLEYFKNIGLEVKAIVWP